MSFNHFSEFNEKYHISGDLLGTNMATIEKVLRSIFGEDNIRLKSQSEILVNTNQISLDIYSRSSKNNNSKDYLLGGSIFDNEEYSVEVMYELASKLEELDIIYSIELYDESAQSKPPLTIQHEAFS